MGDFDAFCTKKVVLLGASDAGKSSLVLRFVKGKFFERRENTIGAAFLTKTIDIDGKSLKFEIWDTAGQERYHSLAPMYYRDAAGALIVFDITDKESLEKAKRWLNELYTANRKDMVIYLVGNKSDLEAERQVEKEESTEYAKEQQLTFYETSAKSGDNIDLLFADMGQKLLDQAETPVQKEEVVEVAAPSYQSSPPPKGCAC